MIKLLGWLAIFFIVFIVIFIILKIIEQVQVIRYNEQRRHEPTPKEIEIVSRDLRIKAENLLAMSEIYELQIVQYTHEVDSIEKELEDKDMTESERKLLINRSLRLQERKCITEGKMIKIDKELSEISLEEYRRQVM